MEKELEKLGLIDITKVNNHIKLDIKYATTKNITKKKLYSKALCFVNKEVAKKLSLIQQELEKKGLTLIIWDGYRPLRVQKFIWEAFPNPKYNAKISSHCKGISVDLTLGDKNGFPLPMPTDFDVFNEQSHHSFDKLPENVLRNKKLLKTIMGKYGFESFEFEWWHYTYSKLKNNNVIDIPI